MRLQGRVRLRRPADLRVTQLADAYLAAYFDRNPDQVTVYGVPGRTHERLPDNSLEALAAWRAKEDSWLTEARAIAPSSVTAPSLRATHAILQETLEGSVGARVCRSELWNVSQMTGWQVHVRLSGHDSAGEQRGGAA